MYSCKDLEVGMDLHDRMLGERKNKSRFDGEKKKQISVGFLVVFLNVCFLCSEFIGMKLNIDI